MLYGICTGFLQAEVAHRASYREKAQLLKGHKQYKFFRTISDCRVCREEKNLSKYSGRLGAIGKTIAIAFRTAQPAQVHLLRSPNAGEAGYAR